MVLQPARPRGDSSRGRRLRVVPEAPAEGVRPTTAGDVEDPESVARAICLRLLADRPHTRAELASGLASRGVPDEVAAVVLERFGEVGLVDDRAYATGYVATRQRDRGLSRRALGVELRRRGVDDDTVADAVAGVSDQQERERARTLVERKLPSLRRFDHETQVRRLVAMLGRKGYSAGLAYSVVRECLDAASGELGLDDGLPDPLLDDA